ncbi:hypothetical protein T12_16023 [Trichinella patagoniensis]|uniref:Uncharacterized protein n=1 Tax=Trichinella patagoniensis TaxID=990121 RepID=A0A0V0Z8S4_9BILA|nr:hypothetical protein T12_16023 [Trichinella patagoniensis]
MDRGSNDSGRFWNNLWQRESTLSPFSYQKVLCRRRTLTKTFDETSSTIWTVAALDRRFGRLTMDHFGSGLYSEWMVYLRLVRKDDRTEAGSDKRSELTTAGIHGGSGAVTVDHLCEKGTGDEHSTQ